jgi:hypothetical protein
VLLDYVNLYKFTPNYTLLLKFQQRGLTAEQVVKWNAHEHSKHSDDSKNVNNIYTRTYIRHIWGC